MRDGTESASWIQELTAQKNAQRDQTHSSRSTRCPTSSPNRHDASTPQRKTRTGERPSIQGRQTVRNGHKAGKTLTPVAKPHAHGQACELAQHEAWQLWTQRQAAAPEYAPSAPSVSWALPEADVGKQPQPDTGGMSPGKEGSHPARERQRLLSQEKAKWDMHQGGRDLRVGCACRQTQWAVCTWTWRYAVK